MEKINEAYLKQLIVDVLSETIEDKMNETIDEKFELIRDSFQQQQTEGYISRKEAASILGVSLPTLHTYTKDGLVPSHKIGRRRVRYKRCEVEAAFRKRNYNY